ncbi:MAG: hypothetical protein GC156_08370 [Actinomycetales bacterium]|nr:hypothetical protein [Actinomycetales bacterium]
MALLEMVEAGQEHVGTVRHELDRVRDALDRTDAVLAVTDEALESAESAVIATRRVAPYVALGMALVAAAAVGYVLWRRRNRDEE